MGVVKLVAWKGGFWKKGVRWQVQNWEKIKFWEDKWISSLSGFKMVSHKPINCGIEWEEDKLR